MTATLHRSDPQLGLAGFYPVIQLPERLMSVARVGEEGEMFHSSLHSASDQLCTYGFGLPLLVVLTCKDLTIVVHREVKKDHS